MSTQKPQSTIAYSPQRKPNLLTKLPNPSSIQNVRKGVGSALGLSDHTPIHPFVAIGHHAG